MCAINEHHTGAAAWMPSLDISRTHKKCFLKLEFIFFDSCDYYGVEVCWGRIDIGETGSDSGSNTKVPKTVFMKRCVLPEMVKAFPHDISQQSFS